MHVATPFTVLVITPALLVLMLISLACQSDHNPSRKSEMRFTMFPRCVVQILELQVHAHCKLFHLNENEFDYRSMTFHNAWMHHLQVKMPTIYRR